MVATTSAAVSVRPSWNRTCRRILNVQTLPSAFGCQLSASAGLRCREGPSSRGTRRFGSAGRRPRCRRSSAGRSDRRARACRRSGCAPAGRRPRAPNTMRARRRRAPTSQAAPHAAGSCGGRSRRPSTRRSPRFGQAWRARRIASKGLKRQFTRRSSRCARRARRLRRDGVGQLPEFRAEDPILDHRRHVGADELDEFVQRERRRALGHEQRLDATTASMASEASRQRAARASLLQAMNPGAATSSWPDPKLSLPGMNVRCAAALASST